MKFQKGTKLAIKVTNGLKEDIIRITADGDWVSDERTAKQMAKSMINKEWKVIEVQIIK
jgi:SOS response regulatory protein OraA/RecX